jgi:hypothetical protein
VEKACQDILSQELPLQLDQGAMVSGNAEALVLIVQYIMILSMGIEDTMKNQRFNKRIESLDQLSDGIVYP